MWAPKAIAIARRPGLLLDSESLKAADKQPKINGSPKISQLIFLDNGTTCRWPLVNAVAGKSVPRNKSLSYGRPLPQYIAPFFERSVKLTGMRLSRSEIRQEFRPGFDLVSTS
jgi:hypothetical protein